TRIACTLPCGRSGRVPSASACDDGRSGMYETPRVLSPASSPLSANFFGSLGPSPLGLPTGRFDSLRASPPDLLDCLFCSPDWPVSVLATSSPVLLGSSVCRISQATPPTARRRSAATNAGHRLPLCRLGGPV